MVRANPYAPAYHGVVEARFHKRTHRHYFRYVIVSENGRPLFDGYAGDLKEANDSIKAHIRHLNEQRRMDEQVVYHA